MSNKGRTTFYIGVTNDIEARVLEHCYSKGSKFTSKYKLYDLVESEQIDDIEWAIKREKERKNWHREWKINLIKKINPDMIDLSKEWFSESEIKMYRKFNRE